MPSFTEIIDNFKENKPYEKRVEVRRVVLQALPNPDLRPGEIKISDCLFSQISNNELQGLKCTVKELDMKTDPSKMELRARVTLVNKSLKLFVGKSEGSDSFKKEIEIFFGYVLNQHMK